MTVAGASDNRPGGDTSPDRAETIPRLLFAAATYWPDELAIADGPHELTFPALRDAAVESARALASLGIVHGDRIAIWAPNGYRWVIAALAVHLCGGVLVPISTRMKGPEASYILNQSGTRAIFVPRNFQKIDFLRMLADETLPALDHRILLDDDGDGDGSMSWRAFLSRAEAVKESDIVERACAVAPDDVSDLLYTSGTTGRPKGVMTGHAQNLAVFRIWSERVGLRRGDRYLVVNPFFHSFGYKAGWLSCLIRGATTIPHAVFDADAVLARIGRERITVLPGPPTMYLSMLASPALASADLRTLRLAVTGAAAIPVSLIERLKTDLGFETVVTAYGLTESCGVVSICRPDDDPETVATTSGCAIPHLELRCVDPIGTEVPRGEPGEIVVRGPNVMQGYFEDPEETAKAIDPDGWLHTGDVGVMDERGYLRITDRIKDMFIVGGFNCYPAEIESMMIEHPVVAQVAVVGSSDPRLGEVAMAFVVRAGNGTLDAAELVDWCRDRMSNYKVPRRVAFVEELPLNPAGKVQKFVLRERARAESVEGA